jgi:two-component system invasion response regulator UvrY
MKSLVQTAIDETLDRARIRTVTIGIVDDHSLFSTAIGGLLQGNHTIQEYSYFLDVILTAENGNDLFEKMSMDKVPEIIFLDINMPEMGGAETADLLKRKYPWIKIIVLTMSQDETNIHRMLKLGAKGYLTKNVDLPTILEAIHSVVNNEIYLPNNLYKKVVTSLYTENTNSKPGEIQLSAKETEILRLLSTEMTYKDIAVKMFLSLRTIDGYRDALFEKLNVKTRVGLVLYAVRHGLVEL